MGAFHAGVQVFNEEYHYGSDGIVTQRPRTADAEDFVYRCSLLAVKGSSLFSKRPAGPPACCELLGCFEYMRLLYFGHFGLLKFKILICFYSDKFGPSASVMQQIHSSCKTYAGPAGMPQYPLACNPTVIHGGHLHGVTVKHCKGTLQGTNISPKNGILKMIFLFPRWDMLLPWRVFLLHL